MDLDVSASGPKAIPTRLNAAILLAQLLAIGGCMYAAAHLRGGWAMAGLAVVFGIVMNSVYAVIHEAEHGTLFPGRRWNDLSGIFMALFFPAPFHLIRQGHLGHHLRNRSDDEAFDFYFEEDHKLWRILVFYGILTGFFYLVVVLSNVVFLLHPFPGGKKYWHIDNATAAFMESLNPRYRLMIRLECASALILHVLLAYFFGIPLWHYAAMYASFGLIWSAMQYVHHYGTERHVLRGARNLWIWKPLDLLWLNHNWHLTHHTHPAIPWIHLPRTDASMDAEHGFLPLAYLRMWRGPRLAGEHVANLHARKVIG